PVRVGKTVAPYKPEGFQSAMLLTVAHGAVVDDRVTDDVDDQFASALLHVNELARAASSLPSLESVQQLEREREPPEWQRLIARLRCAAHVDLMAKTILAYSPGALPKFRALVASKAKGFRVEFQTEGWARHFGVSGRSVPALFEKPKRTSARP